MEPEFRRRRSERDASALRVHAVLTDLAIKRPVFHSEADFQHALAWELQLAHQTASIRLEKQVSAQGARVHLDLLFQKPGEELAIELKYKTRVSKFSHQGEEYSLRNHSAQDIGRHDFIKDVQRFERYVALHPTAEGFAILLTNDRTYWSKSSRSDSVDSAFRIHEGRILQGRVAWGSGASDGTKRKREEPIDLQLTYDMHWYDYSSFGVGLSDTFRYVLLRISSEAERSLERTMQD